MPDSSVVQSFFFNMTNFDNLNYTGFYKGESYHKAILDLYERYGPIVYEKIGPREPVIHVFDPSDVETVYRNEDKTPKIFPLNEFIKSYRQMKGKSAGLGHR